MDDEQEVRKLDGDDLQFDASVIDPDEDEPVIEIVRRWAHNNWISSILQSSKCVGFADPVPSRGLSEPNLLHVLFCATQYPKSIMWRINSDCQPGLARFDTRLLAGVLGH